MSRFDTARVAEVVVQRGEKAEYGSGYRISSRLVLTAGHVLDGDGEASCEVRLGGTDVRLPARKQWRSANHDLALLRLDDVTAIDAAPPVTFGKLPDAVGRLPFMAIGFPVYALQGETAELRGLRRRDSRAITGFVELGSNLKSGLLDLTIVTAPPQDRTIEPWQGMSGAAVFTDDGRFLIGVQAERLPVAGTGSAQAEPIARVFTDPDFEEALLDDGVRPHTVHIDPPGTPPVNPLRVVLPQKELVAGFSTFKKNLTEDELPFVSPGEGHPAHPRQIFRKLLKSDGRGVLLVGAAGTGKTRTGIEVGKEALKAHWRVLHAVPSDDAETINQLREQVLAETSPVLIVVDYLNESQLDLARVQHGLIPEARRNDIEVAILASVRPGWLRRTNHRSRLHQLFDEVELRQDESFQRLVTRKALRKQAPAAIERLGMDRMVEICGRRPIIALLIAREIERQVEAGIPLPDRAALRSGGELSAWLENRLREDDLTVVGRERGLKPARASADLLAAAAAAAACPQPRHEVTAAAQASLNEAAGVDSTVDSTAEDVVSTLVSWGWLEEDNGVLTVAHDTVTDQLVESVVLPERGTAADGAWTHALLSGCLTDPRTIGRFAVNIGRLANDLALAKRSAAVTPILDDWFTANAADIGQVVRRSPSGGVYALAAIFSSATWSDAAVRCWGQAVEPWLADFGASAHAHHLLSICLHPRSLVGARAAIPLVPTALAWLGQHWRLPEASYVLASLVARDDLPPETAQESVAIALSWLDRHAAAADARHVLRPLLDRSGLDPQDGERVIAAAFTWLRSHPTEAEARYVLQQLLSKTTFDPQHGRRAAAAAFTWLERHPTAADAGYVIRPLLYRTGLKLMDSRPVIAAALTWLGRHDSAVHAGYVLRPLLRQTRLNPRDSEDAVAAALTWLERHGTDVNASYVLDPLLSRRDLGSESSRGALIHTFAWLERHPDAEGTRLVLLSLLGRKDLEPQDVDRAAAAASGWLDRHPTVPSSERPAHPDRRRQIWISSETSNWLNDQNMASVGMSPPSAPPPADSVLRYDLAIRTTHSPPTPPGLAQNTTEIPWALGADADPAAATIDALRASGLGVGDTAAKIVFIAPRGAAALPAYSAVVGFAHRWVDAYADGKVLELADARWHTEDISGVVRPEEVVHWAQVGGPAVDGMRTVPFPPDPDGRLDEHTAGVLRYAARLRMVAPDSASAAFHMLIRVAALRAKKAQWRLPLLSTGTEPLPVEKSTLGQGLDLEAIRRAAQQYRMEITKGDESIEVVPAPPVSPLNRRIVEANAADPFTLLRRLGAIPVDGSRWTCPRDRDDHAGTVLKVGGGGLVSCPRCYRRSVKLVRLTMDTLLLTPDEAAAFILNDSGDHTDDFPTPGMAVTATVVGSTPDAYLCSVHDPVTGRAHEAVLPVREVHKADPGLRLSTGHTLVALVLGEYATGVPMEPTAREGRGHVLSLTATALVERVVAGFVPELTTGDVAIVKIARVPAARTRIAVAPTFPTTSVRGSFIGVGAERKDGSQRLLSRGMTIEKIEIVPYSSDRLTMLINALIKIQPTDILIEGKQAVVAVPEHQLPGAIGQGGLNAQLAGQLADLFVKIVPAGTDLSLAMESGLDDDRARRDDLADI